MFQRAGLAASTVLGIILAVIAATFALTSQASAADGAVAYVGATTTHGTGRRVTVGVPNGTVAGDLQVVVLTVASGRERVRTPAGWNKALERRAGTGHNLFRTTVFTSRSTSPARFTKGGRQAWQVARTSYRNVADVVRAAVSADVAATTHTLPTMTPTDATDAVVGGIAATGQTWAASVDSPWTERVDQVATRRAVGVAVNDVTAGSTSPMTGQVTTDRATSSTPFALLLGSQVSAARRWASSSPSPTPTATSGTTTSYTGVKAGDVVTIGSASLALSGVNTTRGTDQLVGYRSPTTVTPTNQWGVEVTVVNGTITAYNDRQATQSTTGTPVPSNGIVISGHGTAADWLRSNAAVGKAVTVQGSTGTSTSTPTSSPTASSSPTATSSPTAPSTSTAPSTNSSAPMGLPNKVQAVYHMMWSNSGAPLLRNVPSQVNVVDLAFLQGDAPKLVGWGSQTEASFIQDANALRARGVRIIASVGGAGGSVNTANRDAFVQGVMDLNAKLPLDGLDWDIEGQTLNAADVVYISKRLKELRGPAFAITLAPNGGNIDQYRSVAVQLQQNNALDMIGQQFYDAQVTKEDAKYRINQLISAGIPQSKISVGMMVGDTSNYWTVPECVTNVNYLKSAFPNLRGGYLWWDGRAGTSDWVSQLASPLRS